MGIHGIYQEIGKGRRVALSKLSSELYVANNRPFRLAIDISIWLFQIQSGKGGSNPALRTFYYRLLRLLCLNIHPLFVFDGPNKPLFKRHKRVGGPGVKVSSIPEFLAKQLLKHFGFPMHLAPGEAEAECALLQREGIVDGVLSEDVDTLMFGSGLTLRSWTPEGKSGKTPTHVNVYDADVTKETSGLDREGMVLVAMMSGGDYIPEGIPGCGPKLACEAARAGFGAELCRLKKNDKEGLRRWKERLCHEIRSNESKFFKQKRTALTIPDDFPNVDVLGYYTHPIVSGSEKLTRLKETLKWDMPLDYASLRDFAKDAFDWQCVGGAKKFIRNLAPAMLTRQLRLQGEAADQSSDDLEVQEAREADLINAIHSKRTHASTDGELELRISFVPIKLVNIDLSIEDPDEELPADEDEDSESEPPPSQAVEDGECPGSPKKKRGPSIYDPTVPEKIWMMGTFVRIGVPLMVQDYEGQSNALKKASMKNTTKAAKPRKRVTERSGGMQKGALNRFAISVKPGLGSGTREQLAKIDEVDLSEAGQVAESRDMPPPVKKATRTIQQTGITSFARVTKPGISRTSSLARGKLDELDSSATNKTTGERPAVSKSYACDNFMQARSTIEEVDLSTPFVEVPELPGRKRRSPEPASPYTCRASSPPRKVLKQPEVISLLSSSPVQAQGPQHRQTSAVGPADEALRHRFVRDAYSPHREAVEIALPDTVTRRRQKAPLKRHRTAPASGEDVGEATEGYGSPGRLASPTHDTFQAMDLASPILHTNRIRYRPTESGDDDLPSPSLLMPVAPRPCLQNDRAMTAADIRDKCSDNPPATIDEWRSRSQSVTPKTSRLMHRLTHAETRFDKSTTIEEEAVITIGSSLPLPPLEEVELDEVDIMMSRGASLSPAVSSLVVKSRSDRLEVRAEVSAATMLLANRNLRERPGRSSKPTGKVGTKATRHTRRGEANEEDYNKIIRRSPVSHAPRLETLIPEDRAAPGPLPLPADATTRHVTKERIKDKSKGKGRFIQPRESLPGAWKVVESVDLSDNHSYRRAFRMSEVETVDLTGT